jgi:hypothetical protein
VAQKPSRFSLLRHKAGERKSEKETKNDGKRRQEQGEGEENCLDLLGWVRDVALARQKYTHQIMIYFL